MSRIGKNPVAIPKGANARIQNGTIAFKGPKGEMTVSIPPDISAKIEGDNLVVVRADDSDAVKARHGLAQRIFRNALHGVSQGFVRELEIVGIGYRAAPQAEKIILSIGYTKPVEIPIPKGIKVKVEANTRIFLEGVDKHELGQLAANIRGVRPPEVYQGKGIRYMGERVRKKAGKTAGAGAGAGGAAGGGAK